MFGHVIIGVNVITSTIFNSYTKSQLCMKNQMPTSRSLVNPSKLETVDWGSFGSRLWAWSFVRLKDSLFIGAGELTITKATN